VVRALRRFDEESFVVKLPDGHQIAVPAWMLDAIFCSQLPQRDYPIALKALLQLAELIELQRLPSSATDSESGTSPRRGGIDDALRTQKKLSSTEVGLCEKGGVGKTSRTESNSLLGVDR
jgi:hypothetical protein